MPDIIPGRVARTIHRASVMYGIPVDVLTGPLKTRAVSHPRYAIIKACRDHGISFPQIGRLMGGRDHSTIRAGYARATDLMDREIGFADIVGELVDA